MKSRQRPHARDVPGRAFTLIEMLLVIVIIGVLAGALVTSLAGRVETSRLTRAKADLAGELSLALDLFNQDVGRYPTTEEGLKALAENRNIAGWKGPYLKSGLKPDPWGTPYSYELSPGGSTHYVIRSAGPDGQFGNADDVAP
jgi:general secretion pathway protein G